jgi:uncharacterized repeat protein (TIGR03803 family)
VILAVAVRPVPRNGILAVDTDGESGGRAVRIEHLDLSGGVPDAGPFRDSAGNLYGTTTEGGANGSGTVFEVSSAATKTLLPRDR